MAALNTLTKRLESLEAGRNFAAKEKHIPLSVRIAEREAAYIKLDELGAKPGYSGLNTADLAKLAISGKLFDDVKDSELEGIVKSEKWFNSL